eukprot:983017-Pelagomonas_calceolata.AAC.1
MNRRSCGCLFQRGCERDLVQLNSFAASASQMCITSLVHLRSCAGNLAQSRTTLNLHNPAQSCICTAVLAGE